MEIFFTISGVFPKITVIFTVLVYFHFVFIPAGENYGYKDYSSFRGRGRILQILKENPQIGRGELLDRLGTSRQSLAELLNKLEKDDLIQRALCKADRRRHVICLTEEGMRVASANDIAITTLPDMLAWLTEDELSSFSNILSRILGNYKDTDNKDTDQQ